MILIGNLDISDIFVGNIGVSEVYLGSTLVWPEDKSKYASDGYITDELSATLSGYNPNTNTLTYLIVENIEEYFVITVPIADETDKFLQGYDPDETEGTGTITELYVDDDTNLQEGEGTYHININNCTDCGKCINECPPNAIYINYNGNYSIDPTKCNNCNKCMGVCLSNAIYKS